MKWIKSKNGRKPAKESPCRRQAAKRRIPLFLSKSDQDFQRGLIIKYALLLKTLVLVDNRNHRVISNAMFTSKPHGEVVQQLNEGSEGEKGGGNVQHLDCGIMDGWMESWIMGGWNSE